MNNYNTSLILFLLITSYLMFSSFFKHLLMALISIELIMLNMIYNTYNILMNLNMNFYFLSILMTMMICESILGISILIYLVRLSGNDYFMTMNIMNW